MQPLWDVTWGAVHMHMPSQILDPAACTRFEK